ncbi:MAG: acyltransferase [Candidatus Accumulibacter sp.]|nr:acyltransferase [Paracoccaceae bacterium]MCB1941970.1 acyltransferase [Accumulibacter sp.]MCP5247772.1 acyltransferase [Accumulibacter sp.]
MSGDDSRRLSRNNFDLLRLLFAATVCLVHAHELSGFNELGWFSGWLSAAVAVKAFFVVSGFLIFMSHERSKSLAAYASKRVRRIYPAYFTVVSLSAIGLVAISTASVGEYFSLSWVRYLVANLTFLNFLQPTLPGVFEANRLAAVNGALWTLKIEVMFYLLVPFYGVLFRKFSLLPVLLLTYAASVAYGGLFSLAAERTGDAIYAELGRQLPGQLCYFMAGAFLYYYQALFERRLGCFLLAALAVLAIDLLYALPLLEPFALAVVVVFFGLFAYVGNFSKYGDFSYGVYIIHFPVIQLLVDAGCFRDRPWPFFGVFVAITAVGAMALWHLVEKRFLLRGSHYVAADTAAR